ncbi:restriction endonuclease subunit S [Caballeronia sp. LZ034LL]|uniref:restriction endonuclease subunit S n=1 Tax=Caballeronia sp. LZ034LL TaxID=3038567 RepID=UPI00285E3850|nr:restriction endonuclease subunit S [Caballeronia sp. LZ034LL]MDR5835640.1 restriction endonuclease subunit S [Caballeronia sp. LZ034LL]
MEVRSGYKQSEVGFVPEDWNIKSVEDLCIAVLDCHHSTPVWTQSGAVVIRNQNIRDGKLDLSEPSFTDDGHFVERTRRAIPSYGDLVITREAPMGLVCMIPEGLRCCLGQRMVLLRVNRDVADHRYILYSLLTENLQRAISIGGGTGSTVSNLRIPVLKGLKIAAPKMPEQVAIAEALGDVDDLLSGLDELIAKKRDLKQAAMQQLLTGKTRLPGFDGKWITQRLGDVATLKARIGWQGLTTAEYLDAGDYYLVTGTDFANGRIDWEHCHYVTQARYNQDQYIQIRPRDVLVTKDGTIGKVALVDKLDRPATLNSGVFVIRPKSGKFEQEFLYFLLKSRAFDEFLSQLSAGSTINHLYQKDFVGFTYLIPPTSEEQLAIANVLSDMDAELASLETQREKTRLLKQGMMQELLTGKTRLV